MNILSFDIEEWYLEDTLYGGRSWRMAQFDGTLDRVLSKLEDTGARATFFCLGRMAAEYPSVVRRIAEAGHDIGCHSDRHLWLTNMTPDELRRDTTDAIAALEDIAGGKVTSFRAPAFSITPENPWAVEVLAECGIESDASIFPSSRDIGGYPSFPTDRPCRVSYRGAELKEYPVPVMTAPGRKVAFSGGGYFRILPYGLISREMAGRDYNICYFHLLDLIHEKVKMKSRAEYEEYFKEPGTLKNRLARYIKTNIGSGNAEKKLFRLLGGRKFISVSQADGMIDWSGVELIEL